MTRFVLVVAASIFALAPARAAFVTVDFNSLTDPGTAGFVNRGVTYTEDGFTLTALVPNTFGFVSVHPANSNHYTGTTSFINNTDNGVTQLTRDSGVPFTLSSIDLDSYNSLTVTVTFTGSLSGGGTVTQAFTTDATQRSLQTFTFSSSFTNLTAVQWTQASPFHSFDNIVAGDAGPPGVATPVPPTILAALVVPLLGLAGRFRRRAV